MSRAATHIHPHAVPLQRMQATVLSFRMFPVLLILPATVILMRILVWDVHPILTNLLVLNAFLILLFIVGRIVLLLEEVRKGLIPRPVPVSLASSRLPIGTDEALTVTLSDAGYCYDSASGQGLRKSAGSLIALVMIFGGVLLIIPTGVYDYLNQFSGLTYLGSGNPVSLNVVENYGFYSKGPLGDYRQIAYKLKGYPNLPPSQRYPEGAKELAVLDLKGKELWHGVLEPGTRHRQGDYVIHFENFVFDVFLAITTTQDHFLIGELARCRYMKQAEPPYTHYGPFFNDAVKGEVWFDQNSDRVRVRAKIKEKTIETVLGMGPEYLKEVEGYRFRYNSVGKWSQINVMRVRHVPVMKIGGVLLFFGVILYLFYPFKRVWVVRDDSGISVLTKDASLKRKIAELTGGEA